MENTVDVAEADDMFDDFADESADFHEGETSLDEPAGLFDGDIGELDEPLREALVRILRQGYVDGDEQPQVWETIRAHEISLRIRLNDLFLQLHVDPVRKIAHKTAATPEAGGTFPTLVRTPTLTRLQSILMVVLRERYRIGKGESERVLVDKDSLHEAVANLRPLSATDDSGDKAATERAIEQLTTMNVLGTTSDPGRLVIKPAIEILLPLEQLKQVRDVVIGQSDASAASEPTDEQ
jgi:hypothetical protein